MNSLTITATEVTTPEKNDCLNFLTREHIVTGRKAKNENGQPRITPIAALATAKGGFSNRKNAEERDMAYIENELGRRPALETTY